MHSRVHKRRAVKNVTWVAIFSALFGLSQPANAQVSLSGEITQGALIIGKTQAGSQVSLDGKALPVSKNGDFAFGFGRDTTESVELIVKSPSGKVHSETLTPSSREYNIQRVEGIARKIMNPDPKAVERARKDSAQVKQARAISSELTAFSQGFVAPIEGTITGVYGSQRYYNGVPKTPHYGLDYAGNTGDPVKAPADGKVILWVPDMFYSGGTMIIDHGQGISSTFLHLSGSYVDVGDDVKQGQVVAKVGASGRATGPHLDWRINWHNVRLDPALALKLKPIEQR
ncbi:M23 family metallopeptidase [Thalassotalea sp. LPB0316]|uniref:M23 family metallopeptidase n=1 Tax=Thalassotalea sp. LPB0316 TaxID=2769490 RepID=UPI00186859AD|nr:M23 family metallopeptidase [Thalassotalea sp. LPB0316]QOL24867.1 M23 family metallopeptidase [Thalassotalea sp. LPB0316]